MATNGSQRWTVADSARALQRPQLGQRLLLHQRSRQRDRRSGRKARRSISRRWSTKFANAASGCRCSCASPHILKARVVELNEAFQRAIARVRLPARPTAASTRSRSTRTATSSNTWSKPGKPYHFGLEAGSKPELLAVMAMLEDADGADHLQRLQGRGVHRDRAPGVAARPRGHPGGREALGARAHRARSRSGPASGRASASAPACRAAAPGTGRPRAATARSSDSAARDLVEAVEYLREQRPARLLRAPPLPPRQPDLLDPRGQGRPARGRSHLRRALQAGRAAALPRRRRRPGHRLRRLADQLLVVDELHPPGVRQRHRLRR